MGHRLWLGSALRVGGNVTMKEQAEVSTALREPAHRVSPHARWQWLASGALRVVVAFGVLLLVTLAWHWFRLQWWMLVALGVLAVAYLAVMPAWRYRVHRWESTDTAVYTQTGWFTRERRIAPMSRVQTVDMEQGPLARLFGLATVTVTTASAAGPLKIAGLEQLRAGSLVEELTRRTEDERGDAT